MILRVIKCYSRFHYSSSFANRNTTNTINTANHLPRCTSFLSRYSNISAFRKNELVPPYLLELLHVHAAHSIKHVLSGFKIPELLRVLDFFNKTCLWLSHSGEIFIVAAVHTYTCAYRAQNKLCKKVRKIYTYKKEYYI